MPPSELDILRSAKVLIDHLGHDLAEANARDRAEQYRYEGNDEAHAAWLRIASAVVELQRSAANDGERLH